MNREAIQGIKVAVKKAEDYIFGKLGKDNLWRDFRTNTHGEGVDWPTAIIGNCLLAGNVKRGDLEKVAEALSQRQQESGGWAFGLDGSYAYIDGKTACDSDSTSAVTIFLSNWGDKYKEGLENAKEFLLKHQKENGGFSTYIPEEIRRYRRISRDISVDGWCRDHPDVTTSVILALDRLGEKDSAKRGRDYLSDLISRNELNSYWWTDRFYLITKAQEIFKENKNLLEKIKDLPRQGDSSDFTEALFWEYKIRNGRKFKESPSYLLNGQKKEGFWKGSPLLRVPHPSNEYPWVKKEDFEGDKPELFWRQEISDQNNLITTSQVYKTLSMCLQSRSWWRK